MTEVAEAGDVLREPLNVGIVGVTGEVGRTMLGILMERGLLIDDLRGFASERSAGTVLELDRGDLVVEDASSADFHGLDVVLFSAGGDVSRALAPRVAASGATVIDNSSAWRMHEDVPLVVAGVNNEALAHRPLGIIANPNCSTMILMRTLKALDTAAGLEAISVVTQQAVSGAGKSGTDELDEQLRNPAATPKVFPDRIAHNVLSQCGPLVGRDTEEELKLIFESRKILGLGDLAVSAMCTRIDVYVGHSLSVEARFRDEISPEQAEDIVRMTSGIELDEMPTPQRAAGGDVTLVGRIRQSGMFGKYGLSLFFAGDNTREGAGLNAVMLAEYLARGAVL